jgi:hypothetical protein
MKHASNNNGTTASFPHAPEALPRFLVTTPHPYRCYNKIRKSNRVILPPASQLFYYLDVENFCGQQASNRLD